MISRAQKLNHSLSFFVDSLSPRKARAFIHGRRRNHGLSLSLSSSVLSRPLRNNDETNKLSDLDILVSRVGPGSNSEDEVAESLASDPKCNAIRLTHQLFDALLRRYKDDWRSALGVFRWAQTRSGYEHASEAYDIMLDILGKMRQMDKMLGFLREMHSTNAVTLGSVAKVMRRLCGARKWEEAVRVFDELGKFGLERNTESMNLLLDTLCKANRVDKAREIFLELKGYFAPNAHSFNILIHGWCKVGRVEEAHWTIQEMKGHGCRPCVISYSTVVKFYCSRGEFEDVYRVLDEMRADGCAPNVVTHTTVMSCLAKLERFEDGLKMAERAKLENFEPDALFYNSLIYILGRSGKIEEAVRVFEVEMAENGVAPNTSTYNTMIGMFCHHSEEQKALDLLAKMGRSGVCKPDVQTYYPLLKSCFKTGKTDDRLSKLLNDMVNKHHLSLDLSAYSLLIHGLCRANKCEWAYLLFEEMISHGLTPRYKTCRLLFEEVKQKHMHDVAEKIEDFMRKM